MTVPVTASKLAIIASDTELQAQLSQQLKATLREEAIRMLIEGGEQAENAKFLPLAEKAVSNAILKIVRAHREAAPERDHSKDLPV